MKLNILNFLFYILLSSICLEACKKESSPKNLINNASRSELTLDSIFFYAKQIYLWNEQLPGYNSFNPSKYLSTPNSEIDVFQKELYEVSQIPKSATGDIFELSSNTGTPKYSSIHEGKAFGVVATINLDGQSLDFGIQPVVINQNILGILYIDGNSPAEKAGIFRGCIITKINSQTVDLLGLGTKQITDALSQTEITLEITKPDGTTFNTNLQKVKYVSNPILKKSIFSFGSKTVGYITYARFSSLNDSQAALSSAFNEFATAGVTDLIVDLRYNGGGYVATSEYLSNLIAPTALNGKVMYTEHYNDLMRSGKANILSKQPLYDNSGKIITYNGRIATYYDLDYSDEENTYYFKKEGSLQTVKNVYFIVTSNTASASELLINNLKPYLSIKLIGSKTFGKPVGFFPIEIDKYTMYIPNFQFRNSIGSGEYYGGFQPDIIAQDDVRYDFGDSRDDSFNKALKLISGEIKVTSIVQNNFSESKVKQLESIKAIPLQEPLQFNGMVESRLKFKK